MSRRTQRVLVVLSSTAMGSILLAACMAANQPEAQPNPTFSTDVSATPGQTSGPAMSMPGMPMLPSRPTGGPSTAPAGPNAIGINGFAFAPATLTVTAGSTVTWTNEDDDPHTVVADSGAFRSQALGSDGTFSFTFTSAGTFDYVCSIHPFMHGTVEVTP